VIRHFRSIFRTRSKGVRNVQGYGAGDLRVRAVVEVPPRMNAGPKQKLQVFASLCGAEVNPMEKGFSSKMPEVFYWNNR